MKRHIFTSEEVKASQEYVTMLQNRCQWLEKQLTYADSIISALVASKDKLEKIIYDSGGVFVGIEPKLN